MKAAAATVERWLHRRRPPPEASRWLIVDVETSGLDASRDRLLALAGVALHRDGARWHVVAGDSFEASLRQPQTGAPIDRANILLHGIGLGDQQRGLAPARALQAFEDWAGASPVLGFHVGFDREVIERCSGELLGRSADRAWLDIAVLAALSHPQVRAQSLDDWLGHFGIPCAARHQAAADVLATAELWLRLWPALSREGGSLRALQALVDSRRWLGGR